MATSFCRCATLIYYGPIKIAMPQQRALKKGAYAQSNRSGQNTTDLNNCWWAISFSKAAGQSALAEALLKPHFGAPCFRGQKRHIKILHMNNFSVTHRSSRSGTQTINVYVPWAPHTAVPHKHSTPGCPVRRPPPPAQAITRQNCLCLCAFFPDFAASKK